MQPLLTPNSDSNSSLAWTLDGLFSLPRARLKYYKKLYTRLLKSTQPGRSDHKLLTGAVEKLDSLLAILSERERVIIGQEGNGDENKLSPAVPSPSRSPLDPGDPAWTERTSSNISGSETIDDQSRGSVGSSVPPSSLSSEYVSSSLPSSWIDSSLTLFRARASQDMVSSNHDSRVTSSATMSMPISHLEKRLSTERVLDIFTLKPKVLFFLS